MCFISCPVPSCDTAVFCSQGTLAAAVRAKGLQAASKSTKGLDMMPKIPSLLALRTANIAAMINFDETGFASIFVRKIGLNCNLHVHQAGFKGSKCMCVYLYLISGWIPCWRLALHGYMFQLEPFHDFQDLYQLTNGRPNPTCQISPNGSMSTHIQTGSWILKPTGAE